MLRRTFLATSLAAFVPFSAVAGDLVDYTPGLIKKALAEGKTVFVDYKADWCGTCASQERTIAALRKDNPAYDGAMVFIAVDWDKYGTHEVSTSRNIPRRSTLIVLKGEEELGRIVAGTSRSKIKELLDTGLAASS
jgi:thiol-disulfide isomerase/thioredoxin